tara:strand:+ start:135 stop:911 length:777 start_codon:yes stop_codon:yes gene_type:complete
MKIISLGMGVQSTALYLMSSLGYIEKANYAIYADLRSEKPTTDNLVKYLLDWQKYNDGIEILIEDADIYTDVINGVNSDGKPFVTIPAFSESGGMVQRQCTGEYKIKTVKNKIRELHGLKYKQRMKPTELWLGISTDEIERAKVSQMYNVEYKYPLIDKQISRADCITFLEERSFHNVDKSSCVFCPYQQNKQFREIKEKYPEQWSKIVKVDKAIRDKSRKGKEDRLYLHRSLKPINEVYLQEDQEELFMCEEGFCGL